MVTLKRQEIRVRHRQVQPQMVRQVHAVMNLAQRTAGFLQLNPVMTQRLRHQVNTLHISANIVP